jgi:MFS family permease
VVSGVLSDRYRTRRTPFLVGLISLFASTLLFALSSSLTLLIIARILQGLSTAVVTTVGFALLADQYGSSADESSGLGQAMGYLSMCMSLGWFVGPIVGGWVYDRAGYAAVFGPALACVGVEIVLRLMMVESEKKRHYRPTTSDAGALPRIEQQEEARGSYRSTESMTPSPMTSDRGTEDTPLLASQPRGKKQKHALLALTSSLPLMTTILGATLIDALLVAFDGVLPVYLKDSYGLSSSQTSLVFIALVAPMCLSPVFGSLSDRVGPIAPSVTGFLLGALCFWALGYQHAISMTASASNDVHFTVNHLWLLVPVLMATGTSFSIAMPALNARVSHLVTEIERRNPSVFGDGGAYGQAYGLTHMGLGVGLVLGPVGCGLLKEWAGWMTMSFVMAGVSVLGMVVVLLGRAEEILERRQEEARNGNGVE